jgi:ketosteroid isomerase-like protein
MQPDIQLVQEIYAAFAAGDVQRFFGCLDPRIRWCEAEGFPYCDRNPYVGIEALASGVFERLIADWKDFRVEVGELAGSGGVVTMFGRYKATHRATGKPLDAQCAHTWWLQDGKAVRFQQMVDTARVARAME